MRVNAKLNGSTHTWITMLLCVGSAFCVCSTNSTQRVEAAPQSTAKPAPIEH